MRVSLLRTLRWSTILAFCLLAHPSAAQEISEEAKKHFEAGVAYLQDPDGARYAEAYQEFQQAYAASPSWKMLGNLGLTAMKLERDGEAVTAFEKYLSEGGTEIDAEERAQMERDLSTLKASLSTITVESTPTGATIIDERVPQTGSPVVNRYGPVEAATKIGIKSGHHRVTAQLTGHDPVVWEFDAAPGADQNHVFELKPTPPPSAGGSGGSFSTSPTVDQGSPGLRIASYAALGVGVVGLAAGTFFALDAKSKADEADNKCGGSRENCNIAPGTAEADEVTDLNKDSGKSKTFAIVGFAVGGVGIAAGVTMLILSSGGGSAETAKLPPKPRLTPWVGYNSAGLSGTF